MKFVKSLVTAAALTASFAAGATVTGSLGGGTGSFLMLSGPAACTVGSPCTLGGSVATIVGGSTYAVDNQFNDIPDGSGITVMGNFLSAGPTATQPSLLTFSGAGVDYISFLWGSPDTYNMLRVFSGGTFQDFTAGGLGFAVTDGNQSFSQYVQFVATAGLITALQFTNNPANNAFETANYSITRVVPEPETYALMLAGLGALGFISRRRKRV